MSEYATLNTAQKTLRANFMAGDLSGFETHEQLLAAIRAIERRMFEIVRDAARAAS
jgi:hypothetical protein